ncbi:MAG: isochorismatase family protein [Paracoccaceae bacterium]|nr:isochorismatase family protein [Paracoccaceae bacterium]
MNARMFASGIKEDARDGMPDEMKVDTNGNIYVTTPGGIWVYDFHGVKLGEIEMPESAANLHWGGPDWSTLYVTANTGVYSMPTKAKGREEPFMRASTCAAAPGAGPLRIDPKRTALIIQDMQNDVIMDGGAFANSGSPTHTKQQNVIANSRKLADACRQAGVTVVFVCLVCEPGHPNLAQHAELMQGLKGANALVRDTWGVAPAPGLEAQHGDLVVEKMTMSAWESSRLETYLRHGGIDTIINTGAWTNMSVEHTARTGADKGFHVIVPEDTCSTMNADWNRASLDYAMAQVATVTDVNSVISAMGDRA